MTCGIYRLFNSKNNASYIGSAINIEKRIKRHAKDLLNGTHHNIKLLADFNIYGKDVFEFEILEEFKITSDLKSLRNHLYSLEDFYISQYNSKETGYNIADSRFGDALKHHPNKEDIIKRREASRALWLQNLSEQEKQYRLEKQYIGDSNPNWNPNLIHNCVSCGKKLSYNGMTGKGYCNSCRDRSGNNNPFYGKTHSEETRNKLSKALKGKISKHRKRFIAGGIEFPSGKHVAEYYNIDRSLVTYRVKSNKYPDWYCLD